MMLEYNLIQLGYSCSIENKTDYHIRLFVRSESFTVPKLCWTLALMSDMTLVSLEKQSMSILGILLLFLVTPSHFKTHTILI